jgi:protein TonB
MSSVARSVRFFDHPDAVRVVSHSAAIAINLAVLLIVMRPMEPQLTQTARAIATPIILALTPRPAEPVPVPPPPILQPLPIRHAATAVPKTPTPAPAITPIEESNQNSVPVTAAAVAMPTAPSAAVGTAPSAPVEASLAYVSAPAPAYPSAARRLRMEGTVTLRVLVDTDGKPLRVVIEQSSGHPELDRAARDQILARWRFQPAQNAGQFVQAWARIPITFNLQQG